MTVRAWRIVNSKYAAMAFNGEAAKRVGGRWNSIGVAVVYTAGTESLAILEVLVHVQKNELLERYAVFEVTFDEALVMGVESDALPKSWRKSPPPAVVQRIGDRWLADGPSAVLKVPSVIVPTEWNYLLNPNHPDFSSIEIGPKRPTKFDPRFIKS